jgi:hypothetical protein
MLYIHNQGNKSQTPSREEGMIRLADYIIQKDPVGMN